MAETIEDLVLRARPEGIEESRAEMEGLEQDIEETTQGMEDQTGQMEDLSQKWQGAVGAMVAGLAVAVSGILSNIPVLQQAGSAINAILAAVGFQISQFLRDLGAGGVIKWALKLSEAIFKAEGALGDLIAVLAIAGSILTAYAAKVGVVVGLTQGWIAGLKAFGGVFLNVARIIGSVIASILSLKAAIVIAVAAVVGFAVAYITNFRGVRDKTNAFLREAGHAIANFVNGIVGAGEKVARVLGKWVSQITNATAKVVRTLTSGIVGVVSDAYNWGATIVSNLARGIVSGLETVARAIGRIGFTIANAITNTVENALEWGAALVTNFARGITNAITGGIEAVANLVGQVASAIGDLVAEGFNAGSRLVDALINGIEMGLSELVTAAKNVFSTVADPITDLVASAFNWGASIIDEFVRGIRSGIGDVEDAMSDVTGVVDSYMPSSPAETGPLSDLDQSGPGFVDTFASGIEANIGRVGSAASDAAGAASDATGGGGLPRRRRQDLAVFISGRRVEDSTATYRDASVLRRGKPK